MSFAVHRFIVRACPSDDHPKYFAWQTAQICLFIGDDSRDRAFARAREAVGKENWLPIGPFRKEILIESRVLLEGGDEIVAAYRQAQAGKVIFKVWTDQMPMAIKGRFPFMKAPRIGESFLDQVVQRAGGRRLTEAEADSQNSRNVDYVIQDAVVELKDMQEEGLLVSGRQDRLAQLLRGLARGEDYAALSADNLSEAEWRRYVDILGRPIQNQVKSAAKQIKGSRNRLGRSRGGVIFLNTGYSSIPHNLFAALVQRYCSKDTQQVDFAICISTWLLTNGFESEAFFALDPKEEGCEVVKSIRSNFWSEIESLMTDWARGGFSQDGGMLQPMSLSPFEAKEWI